MLQISYISRQAPGLNFKDYTKIKVVSNHNNQKHKIGGELIVFGGLFYQTLRGDEERVEALYNKIKQDDRHTDIIMLEKKTIEHNPDTSWGMQYLNLDRENKKILKPARQMLKHILHNYTEISDHKKVLEKYTPRRVVELINKGQKPYDKPVEKTVRTVLFTDLVGFSLLAETLDESDIMELLNTYAGVVTDSIEEQDGEIGKFVGDGIMAHFKDAQTDGAIRAGLTILSKLHELRSKAQKTLHKLLYCGVGIARGPVLMGNIGGKTRKDFTIIGDVVNTASNIEAETRLLNIPLLATQDVYENSNESLKLKLKQQGIHGLEARTEGIPIYSPKDFNGNYFINHAKLKELLINEYSHA